MCWRSIPESRGPCASRHSPLGCCRSACTGPRRSAGTSPRSGTPPRYRTTGRRSLTRCGRSTAPPASRWRHTATGTSPRRLVRSRAVRPTRRWLGSPPARTGPARRWRRRHRSGEEQDVTSDRREAVLAPPLRGFADWPRRAAERTSLAVGVAPSARWLSAWELPDTVAGATEFCRRMLDAVGWVAAVKVQTPFFDRFGPAGSALLASFFAGCAQRGTLTV